MRALSICGIEPLVQHRSGLVRTPESDLVCFAGKGPGEVFLGGDSLGAVGPKVVGISQRRTREHARFQTAVSLRWEPQRLIDLLSEPKPDVESFRDAASDIDVDRVRLMDVMNRCLLETLG